MLKDEEDLLRRIEINPQKMLGKPVIKGTRIPVYLILELLAARMSFEDIKKEYPGLTDDDIRAALIYAKRFLEGEEILATI
ncbi:MAG: DUF433 domain-containing protein [Candidatus Njordarchaeales archaeon]